MKIFITGASGFVGGAATKKLVASGHDVRAMSRILPSDQKIKKLGATPIRCDLENVTAENIADAEIVIHCAAFVEQWGPKDAWKKINVDGTARTLDAARKAGVKRFIHIGTEAALLRGQHLIDVDETYPLAPNSPYPYSSTKAQAEALVLNANVVGFETIVLRPRFVWGPGDTTLLPAIEQMAREKKFSWVDGGKARTSTTYIDNLVHAIELALTKGKPGQAYFILDDGVRTMKAMISAMAAARGIELPRDKSIPAWLADFVGSTSEFMWSTFNLKGAPPLTRFSAMILSREAVLKDDKARADLGYAPIVSVADGMRALSHGA